MRTFCRPTRHYILVVHHFQRFSAPLASVFRVVLCLQHNIFPLFFVVAECPNRACPCCTLFIFQAFCLLITQKRNVDRVQNNKYTSDVRAARVHVGTIIYIKTKTRNGAGGGGISGAMGGGIGGDGRRYVRHSHHLCPNLRHPRARARPRPRPRPPRPPDPAPSRPIPPDSD